MRSVAILTVLLLMSCGPSSDNEEQTQAATLSVSSTPDPVITQRPKDEEAFISIPEKAADAEEHPLNDIVEREISDRWNKIYCNAANKIDHFENWTGRISAIHDTGYFEVDLGGMTKVQDELKPGTPLFNVISSLKEGQGVMVSGLFNRDRENPNEQEAGCSPEVVSANFPQQYSVILNQIEPLK